ncbi:MAG: hypothetical protein GX096_01595 [Clostridiales bacterium]|nr:hypothetical protein [Clostridiales bacterium]
MSETVLVGMLSLAGTLLGSLMGIIASSKLTNYRIAQLETKVDKHNSVIERTFKLENHVGIVTEQIKVANHRIDDLEKGA